MTVQILRDWVIKFNAAGPARLLDRMPPGQPSRLTDANRVAVAAMILADTIPSVHGIVRWRIIDLCQ